MKVVKMTSKGQVTIPAEIRAALGIDEDTHLQVRAEGEEVRMRKVVAVRALGPDDPFWSLVGAASSGSADGARDHDRHVADAELRGWRESS